MSKSAAHARGFTLLEVMVSLAIMGLLIIPLAAGQTASILYVARSHAGTSAALLMRGVVLDLEEEYQKDGFPSNSIQGRTCDLPKPFSEQFECEYDLVAMDSELIQRMAEGSMSALLGMAPSAEGGEGEAAPGDDAAGLPEELAEKIPSLGGLEDIPGVQEQLGGFGLNFGQFDFTKMVSLMPLFDPAMQDQLMNLCGINWGAIGQNLMGMISFMPMIIQKMADNTRQLNVRLTWRYGPKEHRTLEISTFLSGLPEEQVQEMLEQQELQDTLQDLTTPPADSPEDSKSRHDRLRSDQVEPGK